MAAATFVPGTTVGRYVIVDVLGRGGMGVVYCAWDPELDRKVALKLLRHDKLERRSQGRVRMLREARALAKLAHPNVIAVYEVGIHGDDVYFVMELVDGTDLREWLGLEPRTWREVVDVFIAAGRGLAAAHGVGLVHRDFKPSNVFVGGDGRVRVLDFGLAKPALHDDPETARSGRSGAESESGSDQGSRASDGSVTEVNVVIGTPPYMAPELGLERGATPGSDQFSFCVALYEGLYGARPFAGSNRRELVATMERGLPLMPSEASDVPVWLHRVIVRGLAARPGDRWPTMDVLLRELARDRAAVRRRLAGAAAAFVVGISTMLAAAELHEQANRCGGGIERFADVWDAEVKNVAHRRFAATGLSYAEDSWTRAEALLDTYVAGWVRTHEEVCEARVGGEPSEQLLDVRAACLDEGLRSLRALTGVLVVADAEVAKHAVQAASALPDPARCAQIDSSTDHLTDPDSADQRAAVEVVRDRLAQVRALDGAGKYDDSLVAATDAMRQAQSSGYNPVIAEAKVALGRAQMRKADFEPAAQSLADGALLAEAHHHDEVAARGYVALVHVVGYQLARIDEGFAWGRHARAAVARLGNPNDLTAELFNALGTLHERRQDYAAALDAYQRALDARVRARGREHLETAVHLSNLGIVSGDLGRYDEAIRYCGRALDLHRRALGPYHPDTAISLNNLAVAEANANQHELATGHFRQAAEALEKAFGPDHPHVAAPLNSLGVALQREKDLDQAMVFFQRSLVIRRKALGEDHPLVANMLSNVASVMVQRGQLDEAAKNLDRALAIIADKLGPEHGTLAQVLQVRASVEAAREQHSQALNTLEQAQGLLEKVDGSDTSALVPLLIAQGEALAALGRSRQSMDCLERALALPVPGWGGDVLVAGATFLLARQVFEHDQDRARAEALARRTLELYERAGPAFASERAEIEAWIQSVKRS